MRRGVRLSLIIFVALSHWLSQIDISYAAPPPPLPTNHDAFQTGFVTAGSRQLYVEYLKPGQNQPVVVLINGLTYSLKNWNYYGFVDSLMGDGLGILRYDPYGHGETMKKYGPPQKAVSYDAQVEDLKNLLDALGIKKKVYLVGLSYGGALATVFTAKYPNRVAAAVLMAPYVAPLKQQDEWIKKQIRLAREMYPLNPQSDDEMYDGFLRNIVYSTYPVAEPSVLEHPFKLESTFRLVQGIRKYRATDFVDHLPAGKIHLLVARKDQYLDNSIHDEFWDTIPNAARGSRIYIEDSEHKIPEAVPHFSAGWVRKIVYGHECIRDGVTFVGKPAFGWALADNCKIKDLPKE